MFFIKLSLVALPLSLLAYAWFAQKLEIVTMVSVGAAGLAVGATAPQLVLPGNGVALLLEIGAIFGAISLMSILADFSVNGMSVE